ncbi:hypothetical protein HS7_18100 [Sulfolobales archaeon HS-7]|nr:hypothetical protein HS7_18100 [Sulfolobales archaeon HS-7]
MVKIIHAPSGEVIVNLCEPSLLGKVFREKDINLHVNKEFYEGEIMEEDEAFSYVEQATVASFVGKTVVEQAARRGFINRDTVLVVEGVPFAQMLNGF